jgi:hypothetical protein
MRRTSSIGIATLVIWAAAFGCRTKTGEQATPARAPDTAHSAHAVASPAAVEKVLPAKQTLAGLGRLPANATLDDVEKITGTPLFDTGSAIHNWSFLLDDGSRIRVRARLDKSLLSVEHVTRQGNATYLVGKP